MFRYNPDPPLQGEGLWEIQNSGYIALRTGVSALSIDKLQNQKGFVI